MSLRTDLRDAQSVLTARVRVSRESNVLSVPTGLREVHAFIDSTDWADGDSRQITLTILASRDGTNFFPTLSATWTSSRVWESMQVTQREGRDASLGPMLSWQPDYRQPDGQPSRLPPIVAVKAAVRASANIDIAVKMRADAN